MSNKGIVKLLAMVKRELRSFFVSPFMYFVIAALTLLALYFFIQYMSLYNFVLMQSRSQLVFEREAGVSLNMFVQGYFKVMLLIFVFFLPMAAMKIFAEDRRGGTFEFLLTSPLSTESIILGKMIGFFAFLTLICIWISLPPLSLFLFGDLESLVVFGNILGFWFYTLAMGGIAMVVSAASNNAITSAVVGMVVLLLFYVVGFAAESLNQQGFEKLAGLVRYISPVEQVEHYLKGVVSTASLVYFLSIMVLSYLFCIRILDSKRVSRV